MEVLDAAINSYFTAFNGHFSLTTCHFTVDIDVEITDTIDTSVDMDIDVALSVVGSLISVR